MEKNNLQGNNLLDEVDQVEKIRETFLLDKQIIYRAYLVVLSILLQSQCKKIDTLLLVVNFHVSSESKSFLSHCNRQYKMCVKMGVLFE